MTFQAAKDGLNRYYEAVDDNLDFNTYLGKVSDYVAYVRDLNILLSDINKFEKEYETSLKKVISEKNILGLEIESFSKKLKPLISSSSAAVKLFNEEVVAFIKGDAKSSSGREEASLSGIYHVLRYLQTSGHSEWVGNLAKLENHRWALSIDSYIESHNVEKLRHIQSLEKELWGSWKYIFAVSKTDLFRYTKNFQGVDQEEFQEDSVLRNFYYELFFFAQKSPAQPSAEVKSSIRQKLERIHIYLLSRLDVLEDSKIWTCQGLKNLFFQKDVGGVLGAVISSIATALIMYVLAKTFPNIF